MTNDVKIRFSGSIELVCLLAPRSVEPDRFALTNAPLARATALPTDVVSLGPPAASGEESRPNLHQEYEGTLKSISFLPALSVLRLFGLSGYSEKIGGRRSDVQQESSQVTRRDMASSRATKRR